MVEVVLPASLKAAAPPGALKCGGATVGEALRDLVSTAPKLRPYLFEGERLRPFVLVLHNGKDIRGGDGLGTPVAAGDRLQIVASVAGG